MTIQAISRRFSDAFPEKLRWRTVGREAEFPIVDHNGDAFPLARLWPILMAPGDLRVKREGDLIVGLIGDRYEISAEVGMATVEIITGPCDDLTQIELDHNAALQRVVSAAASLGARLLGYGCQPKTPVTQPLMSAKIRYAVLHKAIGDDWFWFTATASDQVHAAVARHEVVAATNVVNALAAVTVGLCGNSPVIEGMDTGFVSAREMLMGKIGAGKGRHGMPLSPIKSIADHVSQLATLPLLIRREAHGLVVGERDFNAFLAERPQLSDADAFDAFLLHEHYIWQSGRPRSNHGTVEVRSAAQQPHADSMCAAALGVAMVNAHVKLEALLVDTLGENYWETMRDWHHRVIANGLQTPEPESGLLTKIVDTCADGLATRGRNEERYLIPLYDRIRARENPGNVAKKRFESGGIDSLLALTTIETGL